MDSSVCGPLGDDFFGPQVNSCRSQFDFTLLFEQSLLSIGPSSVLLLLAPIRIAQLYRDNPKVRRNVLHSAKLTAITIYAVLQLALLVLWIKTLPSEPPTSIAATLLSLADSVAIYALSHFEHTRATQPSSSLNIYLLLSCLCDAVQVRSLWSREDFRSVAPVFTSSFAVKCAILFLESQEKRSLLFPVYAALPPETTSGVFNRSIFWWINSLFIRGFRNILSFNDLFAIDESLSSEHLQGVILKNWERFNYVKKYRLLVAVLFSIKWTLLSGSVPRLCLTGFTYTQPFLINEVVALASGSVDGRRSMGYFLIGATAVIYTGIAISTVHYQHQTYRAITMIRGCLVSLIFKKTLDLSVNNYDDSAAVTLMSTDVERIATGTQNIHDIWAGFLEIGLGIWLLQRQIGVVCIIPVIIAIVCTLLNLYISKKMGPNQMLWNRAIQKRVVVTSSAIESIKSIKMMGLTESIAKEIQGFRIKEVTVSKSYRKLIVWVFFFARGPIIITPFITFAVFAAVTAGDGFSVAQAFTALSIISLLTNPLMVILTGIPGGAATLGCFTRIQQFLLMESRQDYRVPLHIPQSLCQEVTSENSASSSQDQVIQLERLAPAYTATGEFNTSPNVLVVKDASFGLTSRDRPMLRDISLHIREATLTMIIGPVGCGKSTFLKGLLGELSNPEGSVHVACGEIAYCDQVPWLINHTIRQNILGKNSFDSTWYNTVLHCCCLEDDLTQLPDGHLTVVGNRGMNLSGGQRQRVSIARAVYARKSILVLDDIFSGIDNATENLMFQRLFGPEGTLKKLGTTAIFATHGVHRISSADNVAVLGNDGSIVQQGTFDQLKSIDGYVRNISSQGREKTTSKNEPLDSSLRRVPGMRVLAQVNEPDWKRQNGDLSLYKYYFKSIGWIYTSILFLMVVAYTFAIAFPQEWLNLWTSYETEYPGRDTTYYLAIYGLVTLLGILGLPATIWFMFLLVVPRSAQGLHWRLVNTIMKAPFSYFAATDSGIILNRFSQDMQLVDMQLPEALYYTLTSAFLCIAQGCLIAFGASYISITVPFCIVVIYFVQKFYLRTSRQLRYMDLEAKSPLYSHFTQTLAGLMTIRAFGWQRAFQEENCQLLNKSQQPYYLLYCIQRWLSVTIDLMVAVLAVIVVAIAVVLPNHTRGGAIGVALINILSFNQTLALLITSWTKFETSLGAMRLKTIELEIKSEDRQCEAQIPPEDWLRNGTVEFNQVFSSYSPESEPVLRGISFRVEAGQKVGICGRSGSGKSSLIQCILRLLDVTSGDICLDGLSILSIPRQIIRSRVIVLPQEPYLRPGSVRSNLDLTSEVCDSAIVSALEKVRLWDLLQSSGGLDVDINTVQLSIGQQQLFSLAVAILKKRESGLLILDEATSSVDRETEKLMEELIRDEFPRYTVLMVAHRLKTIVESNLVIVLDKGTVVELGRPRDLLSRRSMFKTLWDSEN